MYPRGGQTGGGGGISSTNTGVMAPASGPANNTTKTGSDYSGGYGTGYGEFWFTKIFNRFAISTHVFIVYSLSKGNYTNDQNSSYRPRSAYGNDNSNQYQPQPQGKPMLYDFN